jgi:DNA-binding NarL/FixJ family response regulator
MKSDITILSNASQKKRVIVVDDHKLFRHCLRVIFSDDHPDIEIVGEAESGTELFKLLSTTSADIVLLDILLPDMNGVDIARQLRKQYPDMKILTISGENSAETIKKMVELDINGFISKQNSTPEELLNAIYSILNGVEYFGRDIAATIYDIFVAKKYSTSQISEFTKREKDIIRLSAKGLLYKEIADKLGISVFTVNAHKRNIFLKLGFNNTMEMVQYALQKRIIRIENGF